MPQLTLASQYRTFLLAHSPPALPILPQPPQTVLITGANSGLGLAAACHFAALGVATLLLAVRRVDAGDVAAAEVRARHPHVATHVLQVDMATDASIRGFVATLRASLADGRFGAGVRTVDVAVLNAGILRRSWTRPTGDDDNGNSFEPTLQVNALGTALLAAQLIPVLLAGRADAVRSSDVAPPQIIFVSSRLAVTVPRAALRPIDSPASVFGRLSEEAAWISAQSQYALSKLLLQLCMPHFRALLPHAAADPPLLLTSVCPGPCQSNLAREFADRGSAVRWGLWAYGLLFQRTAEQGARSIVSAVQAARDSGAPAQGGFWADDGWLPLWGEVLGTDAEKALSDKVWEEVKPYLDKQ